MQAIQLVMVEVVPMLTEVVQIDDVALDSESESEGEEETDGGNDVLDKAPSVEEEREKAEKASTRAGTRKLSLSQDMLEK